MEVDYGNLSTPMVKEQSKVIVEVVIYQNTTTLRQTKAKVPVVSSFLASFRLLRHCDSSYLFLFHHCSKSRFLNEEDIESLG